MTTDVLRIALERRDELEAEIRQLDDFIRTAEQLIRRTNAVPQAANEDGVAYGDAYGPDRMNLLRRGSAAVG